jgi:cell wall-associated NlpC family hydrolase
MRPRLRLVALCAGAIALLVLAPGLPAQAAPSPAQVENQINAAWNKLEPLIEQYNQVHGQLQANQAKAATLQRQIAPLQLQVDLAMTRAGTVSAQLYKYGPAFRTSTLLATGTPTSFLDQLTALNQMAHAQTAQIAAVAVQRDQYTAAKRPYDLLVARLSGQQADLAAKKASIQAQLDKLQQLRLAAYGSGGATIGNLRPKPCPVQYLGDKGSIAARKACSLIGKPYIWGAAGPKGFDCSGLTLAAWATVGVTLRHYTQWQWQDTKPVTRSQLRPGDLVFFYSDLHHMGIYVGAGWIVHAPHTGDFVRMAQLTNTGPIAGYRRPG